MTNGFAIIGIHYLLATSALNFLKMAFTTFFISSCCKRLLVTSVSAQPCQNQVVRFRIYKIQCDGS